MPRPVDKTQTTIPNCLQLQLTWVAGTRAFSNVFHGIYSTAGDPSQSLIDSLFTAIKSGFTSSGWAAQVHTDVSLTGLRGKDLRSPNRAYVNSTGTAIPGTSAGQILPISNAIVVTVPTAQSGRGFFGRFYLTGFDEAAIADHLSFTGPAGTAATAFVNAIQAAMTANSVPMGIAQRALAAGTSASGAAMGPRPANIIPAVAARLLNHRIDTQRKRLGH